MERRSSMKTPANRFVPRRSKSYGRSCLEAPSHFWYTPGQLTVVRIPTSREAAKSRNITEKVDPEQVAVLVKNEWRLSYVTPLYRFRHTQLKAYGRHLSAFIVAEKQQGVAVEVGPETSLKVTFSVIPGLAETEEDAETVFIQIHSKPPFASAGDPAKVVWSGWLTCVNGDTEYLTSLPQDFTSLPLFCTNGPESLTLLVKSWFSRTFDCNFGPLTLNSSVLTWLAALWTGCHPVSDIRYLHLGWRLPAHPTLDVSYRVNPQDAWDLWSSIRQEEGASEDDTVSLEEVKRFVASLETHFFRHFRIYLSAGTLTQVATALGSAQQEGKVKLASGDYVTTVLTLLTECAILNMPL